MHCKEFARHQGLSSTLESRLCCSYDIDQEGQLSISSVRSCEVGKFYGILSYARTPRRFLLSGPPNPWLFMSSPYTLISLS